MMGPFSRATAQPLIGDMYTWESQVCQYPTTGEPGVGYFAGVVPGHPVPIDCLLWRDDNGNVRGILNHYPIDYPPWERTGNVNLWVDPKWQRKGIATALVKRCIEMYGPISVQQQTYSPQGLMLMGRLIEDGIVDGNE